MDRVNEMPQIEGLLRREATAVLAWLPARRGAGRASGVAGGEALGWAGRPVVRRVLLVGAGVLALAAIFLPLWAMTLVSTQYPEGLRMVVYATRLAGDIREINMLNHYIGMAEISAADFAELRVLPALLGAIGVACLVAAFVRRVWLTAVPLVLMVGTAVYGFWSISRRLYEYGHNLDPAAPIDIEPFTPPLFGEHQIAQFATSAYFSWGTFVAVVAGLLVVIALGLELRERARAGAVEGGR